MTTGHIDQGSRRLLVAQALLWLLTGAIALGMALALHREDRRTVALVLLVVAAGATAMAWRTFRHIRHARRTVRTAPGAPGRHARR